MSFENVTASRACEVVAGVGSAASADVWATRAAIPANMMAAAKRKAFNDAIILLTPLLTLSQFGPRCKGMAVSRTLTELAHDESPAREARAESNTTVLA